MYVYIVYCYKPIHLASQHISSLISEGVGAYIYIKRPRKEPNKI